jgi:salicylate hydroxylase
LGILLTNCRKDLAETTQRLRLFEKMRMNRASVITMFSNAGQDQPEKILADAAKYIGIENVPSEFS